MDPKPLIYVAGSCSVPGCETPTKRSMCNPHRMKLRRYGDPTASAVPITPMERWWSKFEKDPAAGCWLWTSTLDRHGYGAFGFDGRMWRAHRWGYVHLAGATDMHLDHLCRVRNCVNPAHLEPVTLAENNRRASYARTTCPHGHPWDEANTATKPNGHRYCKECNRINARHQHAKKKGLAA